MVGREQLCRDILRISSFSLSSVLVQVHLFVVHIPPLLDLPPLELCACLLAIFL